MKISYVYKQGQKGIISLLVDGEVWREIHVFIFGRKPKFPVSCELDELKQLIQELEYQGALKYALRRLAQRTMLTDGLKSRFNRYLVSEATQKRVIQECQRYGYLNDSDWIDSFIRAHISRRDGPQKILSKLRFKGVPENIAKAALAKYDGPEGHTDQIKQLLETRFKSRDLNDFKTRQKVIGALVRKGYHFDDIYRVLG